MHANAGKRKCKPLWMQLEAKCSSKMFAVLFGFMLFNFLSVYFLEEEEDWYYFVYVRAEDSVN